MLVGLAEVDDEGNVIDPSQSFPWLMGVRLSRPSARHHLDSRRLRVSLDLPAAADVSLCTIAETPRLPEHCISYAQLSSGRRTAEPSTPIRRDMKWLFDVAVKRASKFNIEGVTYMKTMGVVKNIIPKAKASPCCGWSFSILRPFRAGRRVDERCRKCHVRQRGVQAHVLRQTLHAPRTWGHGIYGHTFCYGKRVTAPSTRRACVRSLAFTKDAR